MFEEVVADAQLRGRALGVAADQAPAVVDPVIRHLQQEQQRLALARKYVFLADFLFKKLEFIYNITNFNYFSGLHFYILLVYFFDDKE